MTSIRKATASDLDAVTSLLTENKLPVAGVADWIGNFLVAESNDRIVGSIGVERYGDYMLLRSAAVARAEQGKGIGSRLVDAILSDAQSAGAKAVFLLTTTADGYFPPLGFEKIDRSTLPHELDDSEELRGACPSSATVMRKTIAL
ncbi:MAG TPA: arsenic resistance N-acetyltransferase ArsN2 [Gemmatimonadaceae bacterium]|nr:arsenic resistance N-acetyltransferase ArsN2 [Gemmatimonadaceae bacterium]